MSVPCTQGEKVAKIEANYDHLMKDVAEIKSDVKEIKDMIYGMDSKYVRKEEFDELSDCHDSMKKEVELARGFIGGMKFVFGFLGLTSLAGLVTFAKVILKLF